MAQLTWRNVDAPDLSRSIQSLSGAQENFQRSLYGAGAALQDWGQGVKDTNTGNIQLALSKYGSNTDLQTAIQQGLLDPNALRGQYGNFDAGAIAKFQGDLAGQLQTREKNQQGIDLTNNQNQYGAQIADALVAAGQGDMSKWAALQGNSDIKGSLISDAAPTVQTAQGQFATRSEQIRSNRANEGIAGQNASTNARRVQADIDQNNRAWNAGETQRTLTERQGQNQLSNLNAQKAGANAFANLGDTPMAKFKQDEVLRLQKEGKSPDYISNYVGGLDKSYQLATTGSPDAPVAAAALTSLSPTTQGNTRAANDSINANYDSQNTLMSTWRAAKEDTTDYKGDSNKAIDAILTGSPDSDRSSIRSYVEEGVNAGIPLTQLVAAAKNNTTGTFWGGVGKFASLGIADNNSNKVDVAKALQTARSLQTDSAKQNLAEQATRMDIDRQKVTQAEGAITAASNLFTEMASLHGAQSPQALAAYQKVLDAQTAQGNLANQFRDAATEALNKRNPNTTSGEQLTRHAKYLEARRRRLEAQRLNGQ